MKRTWTTLHVVCAITGVLLVATETLSSVEYIYAQTKTLIDSSIAAVLTVALGTAIALPAAMQAFRQWHLISGILLAAGCMLGTLFALGATLDRVASHRDAALTAKWQADELWRDLSKLERQLRYAAARECGSQGASGRSRGVRCDGAEKEADIAARRRQDREVALDSLGQRLAAMIPGLPAHAASLYFPAVLPLALLVLGQWLVAFGIAGHSVRPEFDAILSDRDQLLARARRFASEFEEKTGRPPQPADLRRALGVSQHVSYQIARQVAA